MTTKGGLCRNLWFNCFTESEYQISSLFPRCYDLSDLKQGEQFVNDFNQTAILNIIKIMALHFMVSKKRDLAVLFEMHGRKKDYANPKNAFNRKFRRKCTEIDMRNSKTGNLLGCDEVRVAYAFAKDLYR